MYISTCIHLMKLMDHDQLLSAVLEITVGHWTFSHQNCSLSKQFYFWLDKMSRQIEYDFRTLCVHYKLFSVPFAIILIRTYRLAL